MPVSSPETAEEVAAILAEANRRGRQRGWQLGRDFELSLEKLNRILQYTPDDLTMCVEAGVTLGAIYEALARNKQWLPVGAPRPANVTVGQAVATNPSGPFRLFYGTLRDMVIGVRFATAEGKLVKSGGQVVKNVAGYDLGKLLIGSRDTLAIPVQVNFRVYPKPAFTETTALGFATLEAALALRTAIQRSQLTPLAIDLFDAAASHIISAQELPPGEWVLAVAYGGGERVIERYRRDIHALGNQATASATLSGSDEQRLWNAVTDLPAHMAEHHPEITCVKVRSTIMDVGARIKAVSRAEAVVSRAGTGITYFYVNDSQEEPPFEPSPLMISLKQTFDPNGILKAL